MAESGILFILLRCTLLLIHSFAMHYSSPWLYPQEKKNHDSISHLFSHVMEYFIKATLAQCSEIRVMDNLSLRCTFLLSVGKSHIDFIKGFLFRFTGQRPTQSGQCGEWLEGWQVLPYKSVLNKGWRCHVTLSIWSADENCSDRLIQRSQIFSTLKTVWTTCGLISWLKEIVTI